MRGKQLGFEGREQRLAIKRMGVALNMSMVITMMIIVTMTMILNILNILNILMTLVRMAVIIINSAFFVFIFIPWSALGAFVRVKAHVMVRRPLRSVRHRTSRPPSYVLHIV